MQIPACLSGGNWLVHNHIVICHIPLTRVMDVWRVALVAGRHISYWGAAAALPQGILFTAKSMVLERKSQLGEPKAWTCNYKSNLNSFYYDRAGPFYHTTLQAPNPPFSLESVTRGSIDAFTTTFSFVSCVLQQCGCVEQFKRRVMNVPSYHICTLYVCVYQMVRTFVDYWWSHIYCNEVMPRMILVYSLCSGLWS